MMLRLKLLAITICLVMGILISASTALGETEEPQAPSGNHWLLDAEDDEERFRRIEQQFGGFSNAMWAVGVRYGHAYDALVDGNLPLAAYHWEKIGDNIRLGYQRRPARQAHADALFLDDAWKDAMTAFRSDDLDAAREAFLGAREACMACHVAERVPFMNDQPKFERTRSFP
jgi:hypothetical protein